MSITMYYHVLLYLHVTYGGMQFLMSDKLFRVHSFAEVCVSSAEASRLTMQRLWSGMHARLAF